MTHFYKSALLVVPHICVEDANIISSPLTWGFPAMTAFTGLMTALERKLGTTVNFFKVGVVAHAFQANLSECRPKRFYPSKFPGTSTGDSAPIQEEGKGSFEISLVFEIEAPLDFFQEQSDSFVKTVRETLRFMRISGGHIVSMETKNMVASLRMCHEEVPEENKAVRKLLYSLMPGFALTSRQDMLDAVAPEQRLGAWLDATRLTYQYNNESNAWDTSKKKGWIVPIPVGYAALTPVLNSGAVANTRTSNECQFVETVYSLGQWISLHRIKEIAPMMWFSEISEDSKFYTCTTDVTNDTKDTFESTT